jgi:hypothetical protein
VGKDGSLPLKRSSVLCFNLVGSNLAWIFWTRVEVNGNDKHSKVFASVIPFQPGLIFVGKDKSLALKMSSVRGFTLVGTSLAWIFWTRVEVNGSGKHSSLL